MAETRMLPQNTPRSTGIQRLTQQTAKPAPTGSSHVSASAGANRATQDHVLAARQPPSRPQAAKVQLIDRPRPAAGKVAGNALAHVTVELMDRPGSQVVAAARGAIAPHVTPGAAPGAFPPAEALLIASLLERHIEDANHHGDQEGALTARAALDTLTRMVNARRSPSVTPQVTRIATNGTRAPEMATATEPGLGDAAIPSDPLAEAMRGAQVVRAQTTTVVLGPTE